MDNSSVKNIYAPFDHQNQWDLAATVLFPSPLSFDRIACLVVESKNTALTPGKGFTSLSDFKKKLHLVPRRAGAWTSYYVTPGALSTSWVPLRVESWQCDSLQVLKEIVGDTCLASEMKWAPEKHYNS